jgi:hypothetical protein
VHRCGWDSGAARERSSALAASVASRYALGAEMAIGVGAVRARAPVAAGSLPRATRSAPKAGALRARALTCAPRVTAHVVSWGGVGMSKTSCAARCSRGSVQGVLRAPAEGEGGVVYTARTLLPPPPPRSREAPRYGGSWQEGGARAASPPLQGLAPPARRAAGHAPPARRGRRVRVPRAFKRPAKTLWWWWCGGAHTNSELPQAGFP